MDPADNSNVAARWICPLGTCQIVPSMKRILRRAERDSLDRAGGRPEIHPVTDPDSSSTGMNTPARKSLINDWAPNPSATPIRPAR